MAKTYNRDMTEYKSQQYQEYLRELQALLPINSEEKAADYRRIWNKYYPENLL